MSVKRLKRLLQFRRNPSKQRSLIGFESQTGQGQRFELIRDRTVRCGDPTPFQQLFQQTPEGSDLQALQTQRYIAIIRNVKRSGAKIANQGLAPFSMQDVVPIQVAMHDAALMQMLRC